MFAGGLGLGLGLLVGLVPALRLARNPLHPLINEAARGTTGGPAQLWILSGLVVTEIALAVLLVIGAGLLVRQLSQPHRDRPGILAAASTHRHAERLRAHGDDVRDRQSGPQAVPGVYDPMAAFFREFEGRIKALPGVESCGLHHGPAARQRRVDGRHALRPSRSRRGHIIGGALRRDGPGRQPEFFDAMKVRFLAGRGFNADDRPYAGGVAVVNDTFARRFFPGENPIGKRIHFPENRWVPGDTGFQFSHRTVDDLDIIGVVGDVRFVGLAHPAEPSIYLSSEQWIWRRRSIVVRTASPDPATLITPIRSTLASMDPNVGAEFETYGAIMRRATARERWG